MPSHVKPRKVINHGHPTSVRLEPAFWYWLRIIAAECGMTAKKFIECIRIAHPNDPLSSTLRYQWRIIYIANRRALGSSTLKASLLFGLNDRASLAKGSKAPSAL